MEADLFERSEAQSQHSDVKLQKILYFERIYSFVFFFFEIILIIIKKVKLADFYETSTLVSDIFGLVIFLIVQFIRIRLGFVGNKTEIATYLAYSFCMGIPSILFYFYFMIIQNVVFYYDFVASIIGLVFTGFGMVLELIQWIAVCGEDNEKDL